MTTNKPKIHVAIQNEENYEILKEWSTKENRSMSNIINYIIDKHFDEEKKFSLTEQLIANTYKYGTEEERKILWNAYLRIDQMKHQQVEQEK